MNAFPNNVSADRIPDTVRSDDLCHIQALQAHIAQLQQRVAELEFKNAFLERTVELTADFGPHLPTPLRHSVERTLVSQVA
jgi:hypothetical protein